MFCGLCLYVPVCFIYFNFRFSVIFPLYVPFYSTIPRVALTKIMGVPVTGKTLNYILGLQIASSDMENILVVGCAVVSQYLFFLSPSFQYLTPLRHIMLPVSG